MPAHLAASNESTSRSLGQKPPQKGQHTTFYSALTTLVLQQKRQRSVSK